MPLTSVRQPRQELGRAAAQLVLDEATNPDHVHEQSSSSPELVARASTAAADRSPRGGALMRTVRIRAIRSAYRAGSGLRVDLVRARRNRDGTYETFHEVKA